MANKRFNKQVPGFGFIKGNPEKGTEAVKGNVSPQEKKNIAFSKSKKVKNTASLLWKKIKKENTLQKV